METLDATSVIKQIEESKQCTHIWDLMPFQNFQKLKTYTTLQIWYITN